MPAHARQTGTLSLEGQGQGPPRQVSMLGWQQNSRPIWNLAGWSLQACGPITDPRTTVPLSQDIPGGPHGNRPSHGLVRTQC